MKNIEIKKYAYIDALRGFAILGVVLVHSSQWIAPASGILTNIASEGARGVQLFFIASALTLFLSMDTRKHQEDSPILSFFIRRFFRIAPAFYSAIIIYSAYQGLSVRYWAPNGIEWWYIPLTFFFLNGWSPETITSVVPGGWSIAVEMTFYLFVPYFFVKLNSIKSTLFALLLSLAIARITAIIANHYFSPIYPDSQQYLVHSFTFLWFFSQLPIFILGILLYHVIIKCPSNDKNTSIILLTISLILFAAFLNVKTFADLLPRHFLYGLAFLLFSLSLNYSPHKFLVNWITILIGKLSFSIYLVHFMVLDILKKMFSNGFFIDGNVGFILGFLIVLILSTCIAYVTYKTVEIPGINLGKYIVKKI